jgi:DNA-binding transcriptional LysR family regulator
VWETIELRELRVFFALCEELHFGRTAERLSLTQSRVSQTLRDLEAKVGAELFFRTSRRVSLTTSGERFRAGLEPRYLALLAGLEAAGSATERMMGPLRVGLLSPTSGGPHLTEAIKQFEQLHPDVEVKVVEIDLMACRLPLHEKDLIVGPLLSREPRVLAIAKDHPLATRDHVSTEDLADYTVAPIEGLPDEMLEALVPSRSRSGRPIPRLDSPPAAVGEVTSLIARGRIVHPTVPAFAEYFGHPGIVYVPITDLPESTTALVSLKGAGRAVREFRAVATRVLEAAAATRPEERS